MAQAVDYKCPQCGGSLVYDAAKGAMVCGNCGSQFDPAQFQASGWQAAAAAAAPATPTPSPSSPPVFTAGPVSAPAAAQAAGPAAASASAPAAATMPPPPGEPGASPSSIAPLPTAPGEPAPPPPPPPPPQAAPTAAPQLALWQYTCDSCGATVMADTTEAAGKCPYCRSPIVIAASLTGVLSPDLVIPFRFTRDQAVEALTKLYRGKRLLPKVFAQQNFVDEVKGVYIPFWLFDCDAEVAEAYTGTRVRTRSAGSKRYVTTYIHRATRTGQAQFRGIPVDGSVNMPDQIMESIEPFDLDGAVAFQPNYLAGFLAERYDLDRPGAEVRAIERVQQTGGTIFAATVTGYDTVAPEGAQVTPTRVAVHYALLPVWMLTTIWQGQRFTFAMNGQTGRMVGDLPLDRQAFWRWFGIFATGSALVGGLVTALAGAL